MKIWDIIRENKEENLNEGWKENLLATAISVASLFGNLKAQDKAPNQQNVSVTQQIKNDSIKLDIGKAFKSGQYNFTQEDSKILGSELRKLGNEILKNPTANLEVEIISSESQVTNYDREENSPTFKQKLDGGELAKRRADAAQFILTNFINELKKEGVFKGTINIVKPKILVGDVPWPSNQNGRQLGGDDPSYTKDQYVVVNVKINNQKANPFSAYSESGEPMYMNNKLMGSIHYETRKTNDITVSGNKNTGYSNVLFKVYQPNTRNVQDAYEIPFKWWNENMTTNAITPEKLDFIVKNFKKLQ